MIIMMMVIIVMIIVLDKLLHFFFTQNLTGSMFTKVGMFLKHNDY